MGRRESLSERADTDLSMLRFKKDVSLLFGLKRGLVRNSRNESVAEWARPRIMAMKRLQIMTPKYL